MQAGRQVDKCRCGNQEVTSAFLVVPRLDDIRLKYGLREPPSSLSFFHFFSLSSLLRVGFRTMSTSVRLSPCC